ncbi:MAG: hypothetical protein Q4D42_00435 [Eubacteriales bacterium]|nr:hypothetical protein [Eubacteriales bacterium]
MQQNDMENLLRNLSRKSGKPETEQAAERVRAAINTPKGRQAAQEIMKNYGGSLEQAAQLAQSGDLTAAKKSIQQLMQTPEGAQLAAQIAKMIGR